jgi:tetratricopeptide (TPR) repeat protein
VVYRSPMPDLTSAEIDSHWRYDDPALSEATFLKLVEDHPESAEEIWTQVGRARGLQSKFAEAREALDRVEKREGVIGARWHLEMGRVHHSSGDDEGALPHFELALELAEAAGAEFYAVDAIHMLAIIAKGDAALNLNLRAIERAKSSDDERTRGWLGSLLNNTAWTLHDLGRLEEALALFQDALDFRRGQGAAARIAIAEWSVARCLRSLGRFEEALSRQRALSQDDAYVVEEIAENLLALGHEDEARPFFAQAFAMLSADPWMAENEKVRLDRLRDLSQA